jgi:hypothetical protein
MIIVFESLFFRSFKIQPQKNGESSHQQKFQFFFFLLLLFFSKNHKKSWTSMRSVEVKRKGFLRRPIVREQSKEEEEGGGDGVMGEGERAKAKCREEGIKPPPHPYNSRRISRVFVGEKFH